MALDKSNEFPTLLVCYEAGDGAMDMPYLLKKGGCSIDVFGKRESWLIKNNIYKNWILAPNDEQQFVSELIKIINTNKYKWIIPIDDSILRILNKQLASENLFNKIIPLCKLEYRTLLGSKIGLSLICKELEILTPGFLIYENKQSIEEITKTIKFPILIKEDENGGGNGCFLCKNRDDLEKSLKAICPSKKYIIQNFIQGEEISCEALFKNGQLLVANTCRILESIKTFGYNLKREYFRDEKLIKSLEISGKKLGLNGFCNISYLLSNEDQLHYLIEIDSRPNAWFRFGEFNGNDFSKGVKKYITNDLSLLIPENQPEKIIITLFKRDLASVLNNKGFLKIIFWLINKDNCWKYIPFYDGKLLRANLWFLCMRYFNWILKKLRLN